MKSFQRKHKQVFMFILYFRAFVVIVKKKAFLHDVLTKWDEKPFVTFVRLDESHTHFSLSLQLYY